MFDADFRCDRPTLQRSLGELHVGFRRRHLTTLDHLRQSGCLKARFPHPSRPPWLDAAILNTSGGIAAGDVLRLRFTLGPQACATIATQAAERVYRARSEDIPSDVQTSIEIGEGALAEWLPQETILFNGAALRRSLRVSVHQGGRFLGMEGLIFGRTSMGEAVHQAFLRDTIAITRCGRKLLHDVTRIDGDAAALLGRPAIGNNSRAVATVIYAADDAASRVNQLRAALAPEEAGASVTDDLLVARILARDGATLRRIVITAITAIRDRPPPRLWMC